MLTHKIYCQVRNQEFFRAGQFSWNMSTLINIYLQHENERPCRKEIVFLEWKLLQILFWIRNFTQRWSQLGHFSSKQERPPLFTLHKLCQYRDFFFSFVSCYTSFFLAFFFLHSLGKQGKKDYKKVRIFHVLCSDKFNISFKLLDNWIMVCMIIWQITKFWFKINYDYASGHFHPAYIFSKAIPMKP